MYQCLFPCVKCILINKTAANLKKEIIQSRENICDSKFLKVAVKEIEAQEEPRKG